MARDLRLLSVVAPMYDEAATAAAFVARCRAALEGLPWELVLVDDGSGDGTGEILRELAESDPRVRVIFLSRNFGHQVALTAGLDHARGDAVVMIDADLQDPPELIGELLAEWRAGADVVSAVRRARAGETRLKLATARLFYKAFARLTRVGLTENAGDFRLFDRRALDALLAMRETNRFLRGMSGWVGFRRAEIPYDRDARYAGATKFSLRRMVRFSLDAISSFSHVPLQAATFLGFLVSGFAFVALPLVIVARFAGIYVPGVSSVLFVVLLLGGIQLITVGVIGEYVGRIYDEVKRRPLYVVADRVNVEEPVPEPPPLVGEARR